MPNLIAFNKMTSMEIAEATGKRHDNIMRDIKDELEKLKAGGINGALKFEESSYANDQNKVFQCYILTREGVLQLAARYDAVVRAKLIELAMRQEKQLPGNYKEALLALVATVEENEQLLLDNKVKDQIIGEQKPKVLFADAVSASNTTILIGELAKLIKQNGYDIGEKRLFKWLRANGYLINRNGTDYNAPTQKSQNLGLFTVKETSVTHSDGHITVNKTTKVTGKGQQYFINKFLNK